MKLIPSIIHRRSPELSENQYVQNNESSGERKVFAFLKEIDMGPGYCAYHSLNVSEHEYKKWAELDFVIIGPDGIFVLEVKSGRVRYVDGVWHYINRYGKETKKQEGPFDQAETGMYALQQMWQKKTGVMLSEKIKIGWGVIFSDIKWFQESPEWPKEVVCDETLCKNANSFKKYLKQLSDYWRNKGMNLSPLEINDPFLKNVGKYLRPNFDVAPTLKNRIDSIFEQIVTLTEDQYKYLDVLEKADRIICTGGAGTGKTFLVVETARREIAKGLNVLLVSMHEIFVTYLRAQFEEEELLKIYSFTELKNSIKNTDIKFDVLIVDEGQDLLSLDKLDVFEGVIKSGLDKGRWRWFMDDNAQAGLLGLYEKDAKIFLEDTGAVPLALKHNCRNTKQIVTEAEHTTGAYVGKTEIRGNGPKVNYCGVTDREDEVNNLAEYLTKLTKDEVKRSDIVILSPVSIEKSVVADLPQKYRRNLCEINNGNAVNPAENQLLFSSVAHFKGLERPCVILVDTGMLDESEYTKSLLYVAMTRANASLWISADKKFSKLLHKLQLENIKGI